MNEISFTYNNDHYLIRSNGYNTMTVTINDQTNTFKIVKGNFHPIFTIEVMQAVHLLDALCDISKEVLIKTLL